MKQILVICLLSFTGVALAKSGYPPSDSAGLVNPIYINVNTGISITSNLPSGSWVGSINAGYNFNSSLALEGGYNLLASSQFGATATTSVFDVAVKGTLPLSEVFSIYGRAGLGYGIDGWSGSATGAPSWLCNGNYNSNYATALVGVGGSFALGKHFDLRVEDYAFIPFINTLSGTINSVTIGTQYNF